MIIIQLPNTKGKAILCFLFVLISSRVLHAKQLPWSQTDVSQFSLQQFNNDNGLPQNSVKDIVTDQAGFIWLTTESGLVRFDGKSFRVFDKSDLSIPTNRFFRFHQSMSETFKNGLFAMIDQEHFVQIKSGRVAVANNYVRNSIQQIPKILLGSRITHLAAGLPHGAENFLFPDQYILPTFSGDGCFFMKESGKITYFQNWKKQSAVACNNLSNWRLFPIGNQLFYVEPSGKTTRFRAGLTLIKQDSKITGDLSLKKKGSAQRRPISIYWTTGSGQVFFYSRNKIYLVAVTPEGNLQTTLILSGFDLEDHDISRIYYEQQSGRIFLGSSSQGLFILSRKRFENINPGFTGAPYALTGNHSNSVLVPEGYIFSASGKPSRYISEKRLLLNRLNLYARTILVTRDKSIWARSKHTIHRFSPDARTLTGKWQMLDEIEAISESPEGKIWMGSEQGRLYLLDPNRNGGLPKVFYKGTSPQRILAQSEDTLWLGTDRGLYRINVTDKSARLVAGTAGLTIRSILPQKGGQIWFTTYENGFYLYRSGKLIKFPMDNDGSLSISHCIFEDNQHFFWIPTNKGIFQLAKKDLLDFADGQLKKPYYQVYLKDAGFATNEFNGSCQPCAASLNDGTVAIPSMEGVVFFQPKQIKPETPVGPILIDQVQVGGRQVDYNSDTIQFDASPPVIEIRLTSPYFGSSNNLQFSYALNAGERPAQVWHQVGRQRIIQLSNLGSGEHQLWIKKLDGFGHNRYTVKKITLRVRPDWYETWYAKALAGALLIFSFLAYGRLQTRYLSRKNLLLEAAVRQRTTSLNQTLDALQKSEKHLVGQMQFLSKLIASLTHDVRTPLNAIINISQSIEPLLKTGATKQVIEVNNAVAASTIQVVSLLDSTLDYIKQQFQLQAPNLEKFNLYHLVDQKAGVFRVAAQKQRSTLQNFVADNLVIWGNARLYGIIIHNLMDNAIKHSKEGNIKVECDLSGNAPTLTISDTGTGMPENVLNWLNSPVSSELEGQYLEGIHGVGLLLVKEFTLMIGGRLRAQNHSKGFQVSIELNGPWELSATDENTEINKTTNIFHSHDESTYD